MQIIFSDDARKDIDDITHYTMKNWGERQTIVYIEKFKDAYKTIQENPFNLLSKSRDDILADLRSFNVGKHAIFYRVINHSSIEILRVLHLSMDFKRHL